MIVQGRLQQTVARFGLPTVLSRHVVRQPQASPIRGICHGCMGEVDIGPHLRDSESGLVAAMDSSNEERAIRAWTHLLDENPWLCPACRLLLP